MTPQSPASPHGLSFGHELPPENPAPVETQGVSGLLEGHGEVLIPENNPRHSRRRDRSLANGLSPIVPGNGTRSRAYGQADGLGDANGHGHPNGNGTGLETREPAH